MSKQRKLSEDTMDVDMSSSAVQPGLDTDFAGAIAAEQTTIPGAAVQSVHQLHDSQKLIDSYSSGAAEQPGKRTPDYIIPANPEGLKDLSGKTVLIETDDSKLFRVAVEFATQMVTLGNMITDLDLANDEDSPIPLPNIAARSLQMVLQYIEHHWSHPLPAYYFPPDPTKKTLESVDQQGQKQIATSSSNNKKTEEEYDYRRSDDVVEWDKEFVKKMSQQIMFEIILACNFLDYKPLLDVCCKTIAETIKNLGNPEAIRQYFNIKNDFTPEEEEQMIRENEWVNEK